MIWRKGSGDKVAPAIDRRARSPRPWRSEMFRQIIARTEPVRKFDVVVNTRALEVGEMDVPHRGTALAVQASGQPLLLEQHALSQLLSGWQVPADFFGRLSRQNQVAVLNQFRSQAPRDVMFRAVESSKEFYGLPAARATVSDKYSAFDIVEMLEVAAPLIPEGWEIMRSDVGRDEAAIVIAKAETFDVGHKRSVGDLVKIGLTIRDSEIATMSAGVEFNTWRLMCLNGAISTTAEVTVKQRHIHIDKMAFRAQIRNAIQNCHDIGMGLVNQMRKAHDIALPTLDIDAGKIQREVAAVLRKYGLWTRDFKRQADQILGHTEDATLFGLAQMVNGDFARKQDLTGRLNAERAAGALLVLVG
jgi:hypothetical protein